MCEVETCAERRFIYLFIIVPLLAPQSVNLIENSNWMCALSKSVNFHRALQLGVDRRRTELVSYISEYIVCMVCAVCVCGVHCAY